MYHCVMLRRWHVFVPAVMLSLTSLVILHASRSDASPSLQAAQPPEKPGGWTIPPTAQEEKNPLTADASAVGT